MNDPIRVIVADDEPLARTGVARLLERDPELTLIRECPDGRTAVEAITALDPDLVLLDIQMPEIDGFEVIRLVGPDRMPPVVFVTAYDQFALKAFEVHAVDYLLKPFDDERFAAALARAKQLVRNGGMSAAERRVLARLAGTGDPAPGGTWLTRIVVKKTGSTILLPVEEIDWIESADYCVRIHAKGRTHVVRETMQRLEQRLDPDRFFRVHRSGIVNLDRIREIQPAFHGDLLLMLQDGSQVRLARSRRAALGERLGQTL